MSSTQGNYLFDAIAGVVGGLAPSILHPLDLIRTRLQGNVNFINLYVVHDGRTKRDIPSYRGTLDAVK